MERNKTFDNRVVEYITSNLEINLLSRVRSKGLGVTRHSTQLLKFRSLLFQVRWFLVKNVLLDA